MSCILDRATESPAHGHTADLGPERGVLRAQIPAFPRISFGKQNCVALAGAFLIGFFRAHSVSPGWKSSLFSMLGGTWHGSQEHRLRTVRAEPTSWLDLGKCLHFSESPTHQGGGQSYSRNFSSLNQPCP